MSIYYNNQKIKEIYYGNQKIKEVYYGNVLVYSANTGQDVDLTDYTYTIDGQLQVVLTKYIGSGANPTTPNLTEA